MRRIHPVSSFLPFLLAVSPLSAISHTGVDDAGHHGILAGMLHPLSGADHLVAMVTLGVWSSLVVRRGWPDLVWEPASFVAMLVAGAVAGLQGVQSPAIEPIIAVSLLVFSLLVVTRLQLSVRIAGSLAGLFAFFHGMAHGQELAGASDRMLTLMGMLASTLFLLVAGASIGWALRQGNHRWLARNSGAAVAIFGLTLLTGVA